LIKSSRSSFLFMKSLAFIILDNLQLWHLGLVIGSECFDSWISNVILIQIKGENPVLRK